MVCGSFVLLQLDGLYTKLAIVAQLFAATVDFSLKFVIAYG